MHLRIEFTPGYVPCQGLTPLFAPMLLIPKPVFTQYVDFLKKNDVPGGHHPEYVKWLRYFLDFCAKYVITPDKSERLQLFLAKLREKNQRDDQCRRAVHAVSLYFVMQGHEAMSQATVEESDRHPGESVEHADLSRTAEQQRKSQYV